MDLEVLKIRSRINADSNRKQYHAGMILNKLKSSVPADAFCLIGILMTDIYNKESWNYGLFFIYWISFWKYQKYIYFYFFLTDILYKYISIKIHLNL